MWIREKINEFYVMLVMWSDVWYVAMLLECRSQRTFPIDWTHFQRLSFVAYLIEWLYCREPIFHPHRLYIASTAPRASLAFSSEPMACWAFNIAINWAKTKKPMHSSRMVRNWRVIALKRTSRVCQCLSKDSNCFLSSRRRPAVNVGISAGSNWRIHRRINYLNISIDQILR